MKEEPINTKRVKALGILTIIIFINFFSLFYWIDSEINKLCQPSERYNMAESYRPGGEYKSTTGDNSVIYSGFVRLSGEGCQKIPRVDIEFWLKDNNGNYNKETRLKVKTDDNGFFQIKTGGFQKNNLPYHIHYLVTGPGIRPMTGNYNNKSYNSNDYFDIIVIPTTGGNFNDYLSKELSSGDNFQSGDLNNSLIIKYKTIKNLEMLKFISYFMQIALFIIFFLLINMRVRKKLLFMSSILLMFLILTLYNNNTSLYDPKNNYIPGKIYEKTTLKNYNMAKWAPVLKNGILESISEEIEIPEQENMLSQVYVSTLSTKALELELRDFYKLQGIMLDQGAVNMWGADANWQYSYNLSGITLGKEVNITISKKLGDGRSPPDGYNSVAIIWQIESVKINKYIVERFNGFGEGFIEPETLWGN